MTSSGVKVTRYVDDGEEMSKQVLNMDDLKEMYEILRKEVSPTFLQELDKESSEVSSLRSNESDEDILKGKALTSF